MILTEEALRIDIRAPPDTLPPYYSFMTSLKAGDFGYSFWGLDLIEGGTGFTPREAKKKK
ncbi:BnaC09g36880D [Brassica napus]|uniref:BnaC09g36880D protein n=1 Tax=Brassica napus TaxID=3708 RepID=A0A078FQ66_BRANA|nr:BnaC09g36880D [Brassica napus]